MEEGTFGSSSKNISLCFKTLEDCGHIVFVCEIAGYLSEIPLKCTVWNPLSCYFHDHDVVESSTKTNQDNSKCNVVCCFEHHVGVILVGLNTLKINIICCLLEDID